MRGTHRRARKTGEASFSSLTGQADHTTLSSNALGSRGSGRALLGADSGEGPCRGRGPLSQPGPLRSPHSQRVHQRQGILSRQQGQGGRGDQLLRDARRGQSHRGGLCRLLCQRGQEGRGVQRFPERGGEGLSDPTGLGSIPEASARPRTLLTAWAPAPPPVPATETPPGILTEGPGGPTRPAAPGKPVAP